jgi:[ribosomal protein S5]-alanine N-acetyltransferase
MTPMPQAPVAPILETERLRLRAVRLDDAPFILRLLNEPSFLENIGDKGVRSLDDARKYIQEGPIASHQRHGFGLDLVLLKDSGVPIGMCGLLKREHLEHPDLGYAFLPEFWSQGYAAESAAAVLANAHGALGLSTVLAVTNPDNRPSIRVLDRIGFALEGVIGWGDGTTQVRLFSSRT